MPARTHARRDDRRRLLHLGPLGMLGLSLDRLLGGPFRRGFVYGASDRYAAFPQENPVAPVDLVATLDHALGVPETQVLPDLGGRPRFVRPGRAIHALFG